MVVADENINTPKQLLENDPKKVCKIDYENRQTQK